MENTEQDYRIHVMFRRRNEPAFTSFEIKTENFDNREQVLLEMYSLAESVLEEDDDYLAEREEND